jgi:hypothetical protein
MKTKPQILSTEFLDWYDRVDLSQIKILDLWAAWCAGRASLYLEVEQFDKEKFANAAPITQTIQ